MSKRKADDNSGSQGQRKKQTTLGSWVALPAHLKLPQIIASSPEISDKDSQFIAHAASVSSQAQVDVFRRHIREAHIDDSASHEMFAARLVDKISGKTGANETDFTLKSLKDDDGEKYGSDAIMRVLEQQGMVDKAVVVSRWFGGTLIGRARFDHIAQTTKHALAALDKAEQLEEALVQLRDLDDDIKTATLRLNMSPAKVQSYDTTDAATAKRLVMARQKRLDVLNRLSKEAEAKLELSRKTSENEDTTAISDPP